MKIFFAFMLITGLTFFGRSAAAQQRQQPVETGDFAVVYFYSLKTIKTLGRVKKPIYLDDAEIAEIRPERYFIVKLAPGKHAFRLRDGKFGGIEMDFEAGKTYYIRLNWQADGTLKPAGIALVSAESGAFDIKQLKPVDAKNIKDRSKAFLY